MKDFNDELDMMGKLLDAAALRQRVIAGNLANVNTPNFRRYDVEFEDVFNEAVKGGNIDRAREIQPRVVQDEGGAVKEDGNNVVLEREIGDLMKNSLYFETLTQMLTKKIDGLRNAIAGRS